MGTAEPPSPFSQPGPDETPDSLDCERVPCDMSKLAYERIPGTYDLVQFCIPDRAIFRETVSVEYPEVRFPPPGQSAFACGDGMIACIIDWHHVDRSRLCRLADLEFIGEIRGSRWE
jgi:hypothetical protein